VTSSQVIYEVVDERIAVITLNRPEKANAQGSEMLDALDEAWSAAADDPGVRVIVLRANGKHFSAGHEIKAFEPGTTVAELYANGERRFTGYALRWRDIGKPSIAVVQGACLAAGLTLVWPCDLIVASEDAIFGDPVVAMGNAGQDYHAHTWELGHRKAKELLFTGRAMSAQEALEAGMVNRVVSRDDLLATAMDLAREIATRHPFALKMAKRAVNQTMDMQGFRAAIQALFDLHEVGHGHFLSEVGAPALLDLDAMRRNGRAAAASASSEDGGAS
jgi:enoyl-CoA hydratase